MINRFTLLVNFILLLLIKLILVIIKEVIKDTYLYLVKIPIKKIKNNRALGVARKCPGCGASLDLNKTGVCEYCGTIFNLEKYDWVITYMDL